MSQNLGTNRRRIYDIINVLEALEMIVKQSKNWYTWLGKENLLLTLAKMRVSAFPFLWLKLFIHLPPPLPLSLSLSLSLSLPLSLSLYLFIYPSVLPPLSLSLYIQAMAQDDPDFRHLHALKKTTTQAPTKGNKDNQMHSSLPLTDKTNLLTNPSSSTTKFSAKTDGNEENCTETASQPDVEDTSAVSSNGSQVSQLKQLPVVVCDEATHPVCGACGGNGSGGRWDKSLGVLCQKFVMLFLVTPVS